MTYSVTMEHLPDVYSELEHLFREHYVQMCERLAGEGVASPPYNPRLDEYFKAANAGYLLTFVLRHDGEPVGHAIMYVTSDMHNGQTIACEDVLYVTPAHRNGSWKNIYKFGMAELKRRGCKTLTVSALTDLRVVPLWKRMGFKPIATQMMYTF